jgi:hypothetical protein
LHCRGNAKDLCARWCVYKRRSWRRKKVFPVVLTTGPEGILCSGRVGSRAPVRGALPLLGPAAGSVGSLRRMSQGRRFQCGTGKLTLQSARWSAHNSTEVLELATNSKPILYLSYTLEGSHVRTLCNLSRTQISKGGGPSGEFGARNSPRAGPNHPRGVRTEYNRRLARRRPPGGAATPTRVRGEWCWVWCTGARSKISRRRQGTCERLLRPSRGRTYLRTAALG